jgi:hypothetical protein
VLGELCTLALLLPKGGYHCLCRHQLEQRLIHECVRGLTHRDLVIQLDGPRAALNEVP